MTIMMYIEIKLISYKIIVSNNLKRERDHTDFFATEVGIGTSSFLHSLTSDSAIQVGNKKHFKK
jgi:hypothetical protein